MKKCENCKGVGYFITPDGEDECTNCSVCRGEGTVEGEEKEPCLAEQLDELLSECGVTAYFNPFADSKNSDQFVKYLNTIKELKIIAGWAAGKDPHVIIAEYQQHKKEFPELHE